MTTEPEHPDPVEPASDAERVALLWSGFEQLTERLDSTEDAIEETLGSLTTAVAELKTQLAALLTKEQAKDVEPQRWAARATAQDWDQLIDWVDQLQADYSLLSDYAIPPCWPAHPGVVEELAGLYRSWRRALSNDQMAKKCGSNDLTAWHDRILWPCLLRLKVGHYRTSNCRDRHQPERCTAELTNRAFL